jgi:hypothetical protein
LNLPLPFPDALQEFKVETGAQSAQNGVHSGGTISSVTKAGTNQFHGDLFEFVRNNSFNARNFFAARRDSLKRNQFGGTIGGPIKSNKLFFFAGFQGTSVRQDPSDTLSFVPTAAMLTGDFTTLTSPQCRTTGQLTLKAPFTDNRIDPSMFSKAAVNIAAKLPKTTNPCGELRWGIRTITDEKQLVGRVDYQLTASHALFGRYLGSISDDPLPYDTNNVLTSTGFGRKERDYFVTVGSTYVISPNTINSLRLAVNRIRLDRVPPEVFGPEDVGIKAYTYVPKYTIFTVTGGFNIACGTCSKGKWRHVTGHISDDVSLIRGPHQLSIGANVSQFTVIQRANVFSPGTFSFDSTATGHGLADFLTGKISQFQQAGPNSMDMRQWYLGLYGQDAWKVTPRLTLNYGLRWEPFFGLQLKHERIYNFDYTRFQQGVKSIVYAKAPAGFAYPGDPGFPHQSGTNRSWLNFGPRVGLAYDVQGDGRTSIRASYGLTYDFVVGSFHNNTSTAPPWGAQIRIMAPGGGLDDPFRDFPGGNPFPFVFDKNATFTPYGPFLSMPYGIKTTNVGSWNLSIQRQVSTNWLASASYIGNETTHLWVTRAINPPIYFPGAPVNGVCTAQGYTLAVAGTTCSTTANIDQRRKLSLERPLDGQYIGFLDEFDDGGTQSYNGLLLNVQRRAAKGVTIGGNYTWSHCIGNNGIGGGSPGSGANYHNLNDRDADRANCTGDRRHIFNFTSVAEVPKFMNPTLNAVASGWRLSTIYRKQSGAYLTVVGTDRALTGYTNQRPSQTLDDPYGDGSLKSYLNPLAFTPAPTGTISGVGRNNILGPGTWQFDTALSRVFQIRESQRMEVRAEAFNVTNSMRRGNPGLNQSNSTFGQITTSQDALVMQFALKYVF